MTNLDWSILLVEKKKSNQEIPFSKARRSLLKIEKAPGSYTAAFP
jgi:hypothetical protein